MTIIIEYVLIDNFVIDYLIIKTVFKLTGKSVKKSKIIFSSLIGAIFSLLYPLINAHYLLGGVIKILFGIFLMSITANYKCIKEFYINVIIFFALTFLIGGTISAIFNFFNVSSSETFIALIILPVYILIKPIYTVIKFFYRQKNIIQFVYKVKVKIAGIEFVGNGFLDTGNGAFDNDNPVIFCEKSFFEKCLKKANLNMLKDVKKISIKTINGKEENLSFKIEQLEIFIKDKPNIFKNVTLCVCKKRVGLNYEFILHPALMEVEDANNFNCQNKKIS